jgi:hypothetical protein
MPRKNRNLSKIADYIAENRHWLISTREQNTREQMIAASTQFSITLKKHNEEPGRRHVKFNDDWP